MAFNKTSPKKFRGLIFSIMITPLIVSLFLVFLSAVNYHPVWAEGNNGKTYTLLEPLPCIPNSGQNCVNNQVKTINLGSFFQYAFNLLIALSAVAAVFMMVWGGFEYMTSDAWTKKSAGLEKFKNAVTGLLMVLSAFLVLQTVNPKLVTIPPSIQAIKVPGVQSEQTSDFFNQLRTLSAQYHADISNITQSLVEEQKTVNSLSVGKKALEEQLKVLTNNGLEGGNEEVVRLQEQIGLKEKEINQKNSDMIVQTAIGVMKAEINKNVSALTAQQLDDSIATIESMKVDFNQKMIQVSDNNYTENQEGVNKVNDQANYSEALLKLAKNDFIVNSGVPEISYDKRSYLGVKEEKRLQQISYLNSIRQQVETISDPQLKADLQNKLKISSELISKKLGKLGD